MINIAWLSLGSNLGDRMAYLKEAMRLLRLENLTIKQISSVYETEPQNLMQQPAYLNCVLSLTTDHAPLKLLEITQKIEKKIGKNKKIAFGPRNIDIDIILYNDKEISEKNLQIPHPRMFQRNFVLTPLREISPEIFVNNKKFADSFSLCSGQKVEKFCENSIFL